MSRLSGESFMAKTGLENVRIHNLGEAADLPWDSLFEVKRWPWGIQSKSPCGKRGKSHTPKPSAHTKAVGKKPTDSGQLTKYN
ncbi:hypothetical protein ES705_07211 [subsurface metagenome]